MRLKDYILKSFRDSPDLDEEGNIILSRFYEKDEVHAYGFTTTGSFSINGTISHGITSTVTIGNWTIDATQVGTTAGATYTPTVDFNTNNIYFHTGNATTDNDTE